MRPVTPYQEMERMLRGLGYQPVVRQVDVEGLEGPDARCLCGRQGLAYRGFARRSETGFQYVALGLCTGCGWWGFYRLFADGHYQVDPGLVPVN